MTNGIGATAAPTIEERVAELAELLAHLALCVEGNIAALADFRERMRTCVGTGLNERLAPRSARVSKTVSRR